MRFSPIRGRAGAILAAVLVTVSVGIALHTADRPASASKRVQPPASPAPIAAPAPSVAQPQISTPFAPINHFIIIYQENWSFDALYGNFPGANGYTSVPVDSPAGSVSAATVLATYPQVDVFAPTYNVTNNVYPTFPSYRTVPQPINTNISPNVADGNFTAFNGQALPYSLSEFIAPNTLTGDIVHRFFAEQSQIDGGRMDKFVSLSDNPGLVMSGFDATNMPEGLLAQQFVLCDNFFHGAFGGSFLNHQFLISAAAPVFPQAPGTIVQPVGTKTLNGNAGFNDNFDPVGLAILSLGQSNVNGTSDLKVTNDGYAVNTLYSMNMPHPPASSTPGAINTSTAAAAQLMPNQTNPTIGDRLTAATINWKWYSGGWDNALAGIVSTDKNFQFHHQPFAYYANYADAGVGNGNATTATAKAAHLQDEAQFRVDLANNTVPSVVFIKPLGDNNEHPGYAALSQGQQHVAELVTAIQNSPTWSDCAIIITYDEHGGHFDHVAPPGQTGHVGGNGNPATHDRWGPGVRVPAIIISPFAKRGVVDHTEYDTTSILATLEHRYNLAPLGTRDGAVNDLTNAFDFNGTLTSKPVITSVTANPQQVGINQNINFKVVVSNPSNSALTYTWNFGDPLSTGTAATASATHAYSKPSTYTAVVKVSDGVNIESSSVTVTVNSAPVLVAPAVANPPSTVPTTNVKLSALASSPAGLTLNYSWNFGDNTAVGSGATLMHAYAGPGVYTATVTISDGVYPAITSATKVTVTASNTPPPGLGNIQHVIVIYQENWSFDSLYGKFPGAKGYDDAATMLAANPQVDVFSATFNAGGGYGQTFGAPNRTVPQPLDYNGSPDGHFINFAGSPVPYDLTAVIPPSMTTGDIVHRFYTEQAQIDGGKMDKYISLSDNPGLVMSYYDATNMPEGQLAQQYTLCDNFFHAAFGGSFLNHQWLISAQSPAFPSAPSSIVQPAGTKSLNGNSGFDANNNPASATNPGGSIGLFGNTGGSDAGEGTTDLKVTPDGYAINTLYTVNNPHPSSAKQAQLVPNQSNVTIGDRLNDAGVSWAWYSGGWDDALAGNEDPNIFQYHHQPFAYYGNYADGTAAKAIHLKDETKFFNDLSNLSLPNVCFIKPLGINNEHPGYAALLTGQQHVASIVKAVQASQYWNSTAIIITYDENGGRYDHVAPPSAGTSAPAGTYDRWGPGTRVPAIIISPYAKKGFVDHTAYDTTSILAFIEKRWNLPAMGTRDATVNSLDVGAFNFNAPSTTISTIKGTSLKVNFAEAKLGKDTLTFGATLPVTGSVTLLNQQVVVNFGGFVKSFKLNDKGVGTSGGYSVSVSAPKSGKSTFKLSYKNVDLVTPLKPLFPGQNPNQLETKLSLPVTVSIVFNGNLYTENLTLSYTAKPDVSGSAK